MAEQTITAGEYLTKKGIRFWQVGNRLKIHCVFNNCDCDSKGNEAHLYITDDEKGLYHCKKCGAKGNLITLAKHLGDGISDITRNGKTSKKKYKRKDKNTCEELEALVKQCHQNLIEALELQEYLRNERGFTDEVIKKHKLGCGKEWINIPIFNEQGKCVQLKLRRLPGDDREPRYKNYPTGVECHLFNSEILNNPETEEVFITAGEFDCILANLLGLPAISSTAGEGTLKESWLKQIKDAGIEKVTLIPDTDVPGLKARNDNLKRLIDFGFDEVCVIDLKFKDVKNKDLTDACIREGMTKEKILALKKQVTEVEEKRIYEVKKPEQELDYSPWKNVIGAQFPEFSFAFEIAISVPVQLLLNDARNPFGLFFIGPPGRGKTIKLNVLDCVLEITYSTDKFTAASFVSNSTSVKKEKLKEIDMLPRIRHKHLIVKDASPLFSKEPKELMDILGTLTRIFDGEGFQTDTGAHGGRGYKGDYFFVMSGASTPIKQNVWDVMGGLGARLFFYNLESLPKDKKQLVKQLKSGSYRLKEKICREATDKLLRTLFNKYPDGVNWDTNTDSEECLGVIADCALLLSRLRGVIKLVKDSESGNFEYTDPLIEDPSRINQLLYNLCRAHAIACGRTYIEKDDLKIVVAVSLDSAPERRSKIIKRLFEKDGKLQTSEVEVLIGKSQDTALREMKKLSYLNVASFSSLSPTDCTKAEITLNSEFEWFLSEDYKEIIGSPLPPKQSKLNFEANSNTNTSGFMRTSNTPSQKSGGVQGNGEITDPPPDDIPEELKAIISISKPPPELKEEPPSQLLDFLKAYGETKNTGCETPF